jgi:hypothetical protein
LTFPFSSTHLKISFACAANERELKKRIAATLRTMGYAEASPLDALAG